MEDKSSSEIPKEQITIQGSLGLLAYGYKGLIAWRNKQLGRDKVDDIVGAVIFGKEVVHRPKLKDEEK